MIWDVPGACLWMSLAMTVAADGGDLVAGSAYCCAMSIAFLLLLMCPSAPIWAWSCGGCVKVIVAFICPLVSLFFGGMVVNSSLSPYCACPEFVVFGGMLVTTFQSQEYMKYFYSEDVKDVNLCDWNLWQDKHVVYFKDGTLDNNLAVETEPVIQERRLLSSRVTWHNIPHCSKHSSKTKTWWSSCEIGLRPIFSNVGSATPCAWAIDLGTEPVVKACGVLGSGGVCGLRMDMEVIGTCSEDECPGKQELQAGVADAANKSGLVYDASVPLLKLGNPAEMEAEAMKWLWWAVGLFFVYVPLPLCIYGAAKCGGGGSLPGGKNARSFSRQSRQSDEASEENPEDEEDDEEQAYSNEVKEDNEQEPLSRTL